MVFDVPRMLVKVLKDDPLCLGFLLKCRDGVVSWINLNMSYQSTFCYDYGVTGHDQDMCNSIEPVDPFQIWTMGKIRP